MEKFYNNDCENKEILHCLDNLEIYKIKIHKNTGKKKLQNSIRKKIKLSQEEKIFVKKHSIDTINNDAKLYIDSQIKTIIPKRFKPNLYINNPIFTAIYSKGMCCRNCLNSCYKINQWKNIDDEECLKLSNELTKWIQLQVTS